jgi:hypothetical protein
LRSFSVSGSTTGVDGEFSERLNVGEKGEWSPVRDFGRRREKKLRAWGVEGEGVRSDGEFASSEIISTGEHGWGPDQVVL